MEDHEKNLLLLIVIGASIGFAKLLVSDEELTWRLMTGRTILGAATSTIAGAIILQIPVLNPDGWNKYTRLNENGVDLNRNWPANWSYTGEGTAFWSGPSSASELGVQYVM